LVMNVLNNDNIKLSKFSNVIDLEIVK